MPPVIGGSGVAGQVRVDPQTPATLSSGAEKSGPVPVTLTHRVRPSRRPQLHRPTRRSPGRTIRMDRRAAALASWPARKHNLLYHAFGLDRVSARRAATVTTWVESFWSGQSGLRTNCYGNCRHGSRMSQASYVMSSSWLTWSMMVTYSLPRLGCTMSVTHRNWCVPDSTPSMVRSSFRVAGCRPGSAHSSRITRAPESRRGTVRSLCLGRMSVVRFAMRSGGLTCAQRRRAVLPMSAPALRR